MAIINVIDEILLTKQFFVNNCLFNEGPVDVDGDQKGVCFVAKVETRR